MTKVARLTFTYGHMRLLEDEYILLSHKYFLVNRSRNSFVWSSIAFPDMGKPVQHQMN